MKRRTNRQKTSNVDKRVITKTNAGSRRDVIKQAKGIFRQDGKVTTYSRGGTRRGSNRSTSDSEGTYQPSSITQERNRKQVTKNRDYVPGGNNSPARRTNVSKQTTAGSRADTTRPGERLSGRLKLKVSGTTNDDDITWSHAATDKMELTTTDSESNVTDSDNKRSTIRGRYDDDSDDVYPLTPGHRSDNTTSNKHGVTTESNKMKVDESTKSMMDHEEGQSVTKPLITNGGDVDETVIEENKNSTTTVARNVPPIGSGGSGVTKSYNYIDDEIRLDEIADYDSTSDEDEQPRPNKECETSTDTNEQINDDIFTKKEEVVESKDNMSTTTATATTARYGGTKRKRNTSGSRKRETSAKSTKVVRKRRKRVKKISSEVSENSGGGGGTSLLEKYCSGTSRVVTSHTAVIIKSFERSIKGYVADDVVETDDDSKNESKSSKSEELGVKCVRCDEPFVDLSDVV